MKTLLQLSLALLLLLGLAGGCNEHKKSQSTADLEARLAAAQSITSTSDRNSSMMSVASDAADLGAADIVKKAVMGITSSGDRDDAAHRAALKLAKGGKRAEAKEVAGLIVANSLRDDTFKTLAQGSE